MKRTLIALIACLVVFTFNVKADHIIGSDMEYTCGDTAGVYDVIFNFYRDCNGCYVLGQSPRCGTSENCGSSATAPTSLTVKCITSNGSSTVGSLSMTRTGIEDITTTCSNAKSRCEQPCNGSFPYGIEKHTFKGRLDLRTAITNGCCKFEISVRLFVRNVGITTGQSQQAFWTSCEIDACEAPCNSSPALSNDPVAILCCNQPYSFNNGALDTTNFDSLSYAFAPAYQNENQQCSYTGNKFYQNPISTYYPGSLSFPYKNPQASPPIGTYLDPVTGDLIFTPINCGEIAVVVIEITEWRKDSTGTYKEIGATRRDMQFIVMTCPDNNPPVINGPYSYEVCAGSQLCFNITTNDVVFVPPPPAPTPPADTVTINWNAGIPGATFNVINPTARLQTGQFCWTPGLNQASDLPYTFTVTARDNACPLNAVTVRSFRVKVKHRAQADRDIDTLPCGEYAVHSEPIAGFRGTPSYRWQILDSNLNIVFDRRIAKFNSNGSFLSLNQDDTITFRQGGFYIIQHTINNTPQNCPSTYYDTLIVPSLLRADLSVGPDTFICAGTTLRLEPYLANGTSPFSYQWSTMGIDTNYNIINNATANPGDTLTYFDLTVPAVQYDTAVALIITDGIGCTTEDTIQVFLKANPLVVMPPDPRICTYDSVLIIPNYDTAYWVDRFAGDTLRQGDTLWKEWFYNGSGIAFATDDSMVLRDEGQYVVRVYDSLGCWDTDTMFLNVNDTVKADAGPDRVLCYGDSLILLANGLDTAGNSKTGAYTWHDVTNSPANVFIGQDRQYVYSAASDGDYRLALVVNEGGVTCHDTDFVSFVVNPLPVISLRPDQIVCCDYGNISLNFQINSPTGGYWNCNSNPSYISNNTFFTDSACGPVQQNIYAVYNYIDPNTLCENKDSQLITVNPLPTIITKEGDFCQDLDSFKLGNRLITSPANTNAGTPSWKCLDCNGNDFNNMLVDKGPGGGIKDWWLYINPSKYTIQNPDKDTVTLEFTYVDQRGCRSKDTVSFRIWRVPTILFDDEIELCWDHGLADLSIETGVNLDDGVWSVVDSTGFRNSSTLGGINGDTINTLNSTQLPYPTPAIDKYAIRYTHTASGCPVFRDTFLTIHPLPTINLTDFARQPPNYCEDNVDIPLNANPGGGTWTTTDPSALIAGNTFSPSSASVIGSPIWFEYTYQDPVTGCTNSDSIDAFVDPLPTINVPNDTAFCRPLGQGTVTMPYNITGTNYSFLGWNTTDVYNNKSRMSVTASYAPGTATMQTQNDTSESFRYILFAGGLGSCNDIDDFWEVTIHPRPDASITPSNPNGCNPVSTDFNVNYNNSVDSASATYLWDLGGGNGTSSSSEPSATYTSDGTNNVSLVLTTPLGCDTTITSSIDVYPLPTAKFTPNPDNFTTAALPFFVFNDESSVANTLGSNITNWSWDFGDPNSNTDVSNEQNPSYFYPPDTMEYNVKLVVETNFGCKDSFIYPVEIGPDLIVYIPNAFSPEGSGPTDNEGFRAVISGEKAMELVVFNRWGEIMFRTTDKTQKWDGNFKGLEAQQDVYAYVLKVTALDDDEYTYTGTLTLIR